MEDKKKIFDKIKVWLESVAKPFIIQNKVMIISALSVIVIGIVLIVVFWAKFNNDAAPGTITQTKVIDNTEAVEDVAEVVNRTVEDVPELLLEVDAYEDVNTFVSEYYKCLSVGDIDKLNSMMDFFDDTEKIKIQKRSGYIENYNNIKVYTKLGVEADSYIVYSYYELKFKDIETPAPGLDAYYIYKNDAGDYKIANEIIDDSITKYIQEANKQDDVVDLFNKSSVTYNEIISKDLELAEFLNELPVRLKTEIGEEIAAVEVAHNVEEAVAAELASEEVEASKGKATEVTATTKVNVRVSDSLEADRVGQAMSGETFECLEVKGNGWCKILFEDKEGYIKVDYVEIKYEDVESEESETDEVNEDIDTDTNEEVDAETTTSEISDSKTAKANTAINIRKEASAESDRVGSAYQGEEFDIIENLSNGWSKIKYNGGEAFIKSENLEFQ